MQNKKKEGKRVVAVGASKSSPVLPAIHVDHDVRMLGILHRARSTISTPKVRELLAIRTFLAGEKKYYLQIKEKDSDEVKRFSEMLDKLLVDIGIRQYSEAKLIEITEELRTQLIAMSRAHPDDQNFQKVCAAIAKHCRALELQQIIAGVGSVAMIESALMAAAKQDRLAPPVKTAEVLLETPEPDAAMSGFSSSKSAGDESTSISEISSREGSTSVASDSGVAKKVGGRDFAFEDSSKIQELLGIIGINPDKFRLEDPILLLVKQVTGLMAQRSGSKVRSIVQVSLGRLDACQQVLRELLSHGYAADATDLEGNTALHLAARCGDLTTFKLLLAVEEEHGVFNKVNAAGNTPLQVAIKNGQLEIVEHMMQTLNPEHKFCRADATTVDADAASPIVAAAKLVYDCYTQWQAVAPTDQSANLCLQKLNRARAILLCLLTNNFNSSLGDRNGDTAAHIIAAAGDDVAMTYMIRGVAALDVKNKLGETPMFIAQKNWKVNIINLLENAYNAANKFIPVISCNVKNRKGVSPVLLHILSDDQESLIPKLHFLFSQGVSYFVDMKKQDFHALAVEYLTPEQLASESYRQFITMLDESSNKDKYHVNLANLAVALGYDIAAKHIKKYVYIERAVKNALNHSGDLDEVLDSKGNTLVHKAVQLGSRELVLRLAKSGRSDFTQPNDEGCTPFSLMVMRGDRALIESFFEIRQEDMAAIAEADPAIILRAVIAAGQSSRQLNTSDCANRQYYTHRVKGLNKIISDLAMWAGSIIDATTETEKTACHIAVMTRNLEALITLAQHCLANLRIQDAAGRTPLFEAIEQGFFPAVQYLVGECKVSVDEVNKFGVTPALWAVLCQNIEAYDYLCQQGAEKEMVLEKRALPDILKVIGAEEGSMIAKYFDSIDDSTREHYVLNLDECFDALKAQDAEARKTGESSKDSGHDLGLFH